MIEILMVGGILSILAMIGVASAFNYTKKGRDAARIQTMAETLRTLKLSDSTQALGNEAYIYSEDQFKEALSSANITLSSRIYGNICYFIGMAAGPTASVKDNEFVIATWGETTSTFNDTQPGVLAVGTDQGVSNMIRAGGMEESYFHCDKPANFDLLQSAFQGDYAP